MTEQQAHILVVDDDADLRDSLTDVLEDAGYSVASARDGLHALRELRRAVRRPDLILLDLQMPGMGGVEFRSEQLKDDELAGIPVAIVTADVNAREQSARLRAAGWLPKPLVIRDLLAMIPDVLERGAGENTPS